MDKYKELVMALRCCSNERCNECPRKEWEYCYLKTEGEAANAIEELNKTRKKGKWEYSEDDASWCCGSCGCVFEEIEGRPQYNFCPNCGAKMNGEEE